MALTIPADIIQYYGYLLRAVQKLFDIKDVRIIHFQFFGETVMDIKWVDGFEIKVNSDGRLTIISANREGLLSLARQLKDLAKEEPGSHIHYDDYNSLAEGSDELIIEKI